MMKLIVFCLLALDASALIVWPFQNPGASFIINLNAQIGNPGQSIELGLVISNDNCPGLLLQSIESKIIVGFNSSASTTFKKTGDYKENGHVDGIAGLDNIVITSSDGKPQKLTQKPINVVNTPENCYGNILSLSHDDSAIKNDFLDAVFKEQKEQVVVLTYDTIPPTRDEEQPTTGKLYIGERPVDVCSSDWQLFGDVTSDADFDQWNFKLDKVSVGKFAAFQPGTARFNIYAPYLRVSPSTYDAITAELNLQYRPNHQMPCNTTKEVIFTANGFDFHIKPQDYMDMSSGDEDGYCSSSLLSNYEENEFELPFSILRRHCLVYDYKNKQVGLSKEIN